ncbi:hypothetical protein GHK92_10690 [Nocardioides sp. dk4132]|uniref:hypothetical protein n=1 Tax=unclassified Nocardioides TaxID=2615069 RepID=UPI0012949803|nr:MULTISPECIES: hypothetical protein [unclassified Nocardioides]MQW76344.1 hypothetical protein [Nocardioides sp. dk4132]QGA07377.1 hypothetical protein GFH29_08230 [Nocardioides sp. dk884]
MGGADERRHERGAATLETTGVAIIAATLILAVMLAALPQGTRLAETYSYWVCQVVTFGQGGCAPPSSAPESREPTEPCVLTQDGVERNQEISVLVVTAADGRRIEIQKLSNGEYRVSVTDSNSAGASVGVGGGLTVTVNDTTVGGNASAGAGASVDIRAGAVYHASEDEMGDLMDALTQDQVKDAVVGEGGPFRWLTDGLTNLAGIGKDLPVPDEIYAEGGISLNASAEATGLTDHAAAGVSASTVLGTRKNRDGTTTVYLRSEVSGEAGLQSLGVDTTGPKFKGAELEGSAELVTAVTFDSEGNMVQVSATATAGGSSSGVASALFGGSLDADLANQESGLRIYQASLDTDNPANQAAAQQFLLAQGVSSLGAWTNPALTAVGNIGFVQAAMDNGTVTQQDYDTDSNTVFGIDGSGKLGIELGVSAEVKTDSMTTTGAQYWDGTQWANWEACSA